MGAATALLGASGMASASTELGEQLDEIVVWSPKSEIMKRAKSTGGRTATGTNETYPVRFVTYLARFLLNYDKASRQLWDRMATTIPINFSMLEVEAVRRDQFAEFAKAVQVGLLDFQGPQGIKAFFSLMRSRYGQGEECKRQLAILFSFMEESQPTESIELLLGEVDNGQVNNIVVTDPGGGYTGKVPKVTVSGSQAGKQATARAVLRETGHLVGVRLKDCGSSKSFEAPPRVYVSAPADPEGVQAEARAILDKRQGFISTIEITNPGSGYNTALAPVTVEVFGADVDETGDYLVESVLKEGTGGAMGETACPSNFVAEAIVDREVGSVEILTHGDGYATSVPLVVEIQSPEESEGRPGGTRAYAVGLVAAGLAIDDSKTGLPVPDTSVTSKLAQMLPAAVADTLTINEKGCYESLDLVDLPGGTSKVSPGSPTDSRARKGPTSSAMFDPVFGPVGRSPLEKEAVLKVEDYLKLSLAGAACNALVRFFLHPVDCVKTTVQAEMGREVRSDENGMEGGGGGGEGWIGTVKGILKKGGVGELTRGIDVSTILGFMLGFIGFGGTELFRRELTRMMEMMPAGSETGSSVWVILLASALAQVVSAIITCPVEAVRIRVMTCDRRPEFLSFIGKAQEMVDQEGLLYFWSGLGTLLSRELPFGIAKFLTFELVRDKIFQEVPAAQESVFYALVVSILAGMTAGVAGAIVSQPADTILTRINTVVPKSSPVPAAAATRRRPWDLKPSLAGSVGSSSSSAAGGGVFGREGVGLMEKNNASGGGGGVEDSAGPPDWKEVVREVFEGEEGIGGLFSGLGLRAVFFGAAIALQFFAFDYFKVLLQVAPDDLQLVLDVFADRLSFYTGGGP
ncbi:unnamed protein product [Ectocarpus sp. 6 AP-2014]